MATIEIDGNKYEVEDGKNLLDACLGLGLDLPYFCWHPSMGSVGSCRQCAVRVYQNEEDMSGRILMGCMTPVADGMRLSMEEKTVSAFRDKCIEVTMANHPHDCPVCEEGGECHLQDVTIMSDHTTRRYRGEKKTYENQDLGPCIGHEMNRCITCYRCVRFYNDYAGGKDLAVMGSRENTYFGRHEDGCLESVFSGNLVEVCPTGVFTDKTLARSYNRKWDLQTAPSICHGCSLGCNISPSERHGKIKRITNRYHGEVNGYFICDKGRFAYDHVNSDFRLRDCFQGETKVDYTTSITVAGEYLVNAGTENILGIASEKASVEENLLLKSLVGSQNFCSGMSATRQALLQEILSIYQSPAVEVASMKSMEACDAVLILGEDLINSAPRMALSVRQSTRNLSFEMADATRIPRWQDESVRILAQEQRSPLIIASVAGTGLDEIASETLLASPNDIANFGYAIAHACNEKYASVKVSEKISELAGTVAEKLLNAKNPLIISGCSLNSIEIVKAAAQISAAIASRRSNESVVTTPISYVLPEANSLGLAMLFDNNTFSVENLVEKTKGDTSAIILQNDLYHHAQRDSMNMFFDKCANIITLSQLPNETTRRSALVIPAASIVETEGTLVNNEGRAQRFFKVFSGSNPSINDNWKTLIKIARELVNKCKATNEGKLRSELKALATIESFDDLSRLVEGQAGYFKLWSGVAPDSTFRIAGMKMPRQPHRYSGRTSLQANIKVAENKAPEDSDSALAFTMEGSPINRPPALNALTWSPGWNSNEAINKFQAEIGGPLKGGDPGVRLIKTEGSTDLKYTPCEVPESDLLAVCHSRIFDNCELSVLSSALSQRAEMRSAMMGQQTAEKYALSNGDRVSIKVGASSVSLLLVVNNNMPEKIVTIPDDVQTRVYLSSSQLPAACEVSRGAHD